jgi:hypothetical protein
VLTGSSGSVASVVRFPYLHILIETEDFLWANRHDAIWSTVEGGMGIVAFSLAAMRPLFIAFLARSRSVVGTSDQNPSRLRYFSKKPTGDDLELRSDFGKSIRVTTTIVKSESSRVRKNQEVYKKSSESEIELKEDSKWSAHLETESCEDVGPDTVIKGGGHV